MTFKDKLDILNALYEDAADIQMEVGPRLHTLSSDELRQVELDLIEIKNEIIMMENEMFIKNPYYVGEVSRRMH